MSLKKLIKSLFTSNPNREEVLALIDEMWKYGVPLNKNPYHQKLIAITEGCNHKWIYSPDKEKRICSFCCAKERRGNRSPEGYSGSLWVAPPEEVDRYNLRKVFAKWES